MKRDRIPKMINIIILFFLVLWAVAFFGNDFSFNRIEYVAPLIGLAMLVPVIYFLHRIKKISAINRETMNGLIALSQEYDNLDIKRDAFMKSKSKDTIEHISMMFYFGLLRED